MGKSGAKQHNTKNIYLLVIYSIIKLPYKKKKKLPEEMDGWFLSMYDKNHYNIVK